MHTTHASVCGAITGLLLGCAICLIQNIAVSDALFRIFVLTLSGAWIGMLLAWLDQLIPDQTMQQEESADRQDIRQ